MHEASLMRALMRKIQDLAQEQGAKKVISIRIWLGALSHMSAAHFQEHFDQVAPGTVADGALLQIELSEDIHDPNAQELLLRSIEVET